MLRSLVGSEMCIRDRYYCIYILLGIFIVGNILNEVGFQGWKLHCQVSKFCFKPNLVPNNERNACHSHQNDFSKCLRDLIRPNQFNNRLARALLAIKRRRRDDLIPKCREMFANEEDFLPTELVQEKLKQIRPERIKTKLKPLITVKLTII